jgi:hypothetical protein
MPTHQQQQGSFTMIIFLSDDSGNELTGSNMIICKPSIFFTIIRNSFSICNILNGAKNGNVFSQNNFQVRSMIHF